MSDVEHFQRVSDLFERLRILPEDQRLAVLEEAATDDPRIAAEVGRLLCHHDRERDELDVPIVSPTDFARASRISPIGSDRLPKQIGRYRVQRLIGRGGMGMVFLAEQEHPRRQVALKIIRPEFLTDRVIRRFELEADLLGHLRHPGIASDL